jgi:hypothetical protein
LTFYGFHRDSRVTDSARAEDARDPQASLGDSCMTKQKNHHFDFILNLDPPLAFRTLNSRNIVLCDTLFDALSKACIPWLDRAQKDPDWTGAGGREGPILDLIHSRKE